MEVAGSAASRRRIKQTTNFTVIALIVLGILAVLNFFFYRHFSRIDLTHDKRYTLTPASRQALAGLDDIVNIKLYVSQKLPSYLVNLKRDITDLLDEYKAYGSGNIAVTSIDPTEDPALQQELRFMGIPQVQLNIIEKDQAQLTNAYLGMAIFYADKKEVIPFISDTKNLEYDLTSAIVKVTSKETKKVGLYVGSKPQSPDEQEYQAASQLLSKQYEVSPIKLDDEQALDNISTLILAGPRELTDRQKYAIDQFIMRGGKAVFLVDTVEMREGLQATGFKPAVNDLLQQYGITVEENLVLDASNAYAAFRSGFMTFRIPYPFWVKVVSEGFAADNPAVSMLESLVLPWVSSLTVAAEKKPDIAITELAKSTESSWLQKGFYMLDPQQQFIKPGTQMQSYLLAAAATGKFKSFFADKPVPPVEKKADGTEAPPQKETIKESPETRIVVVGNSRFITNDVIGQFDDNQVFFLNLIDWLTLGEQLIGIRSRGATDRPLRETTEYQKTLVKSLNMFGIPLVLALFGIARFYVKRRKKKSGTVEL
jgi:gliding-associated putative ABC transporter substrate-binding component GldG